MKREEKNFLEYVYSAVGQEDYDRESIKSRFLEFKKYIKERFSFNCPIVIVGGTNGKGSVVQNLNEQALFHGLKTAVWTSPHIESLVERYQNNESHIEWDKLEKLIRDELNSSKIKLSLFELFFVVFCEWAQALELDLIILEVGLGGRLDAVNVFDADLSVITSISRDHIKYLGNSYKKILNEKIQIARKNKPVIVQTPLAFLHTHIKEQAQKIGAQVQILSQEKTESFVEINSRVSEVAWKRLFPQFSFNKKALSLQRVESCYKNITFNGAHNSDGMRQLMNQLCRSKHSSKQMLLVAFSKRPADEVYLLLKIVNRYKSLFSSIIVTSFEHSRSLDLGLSRQIASESGIVFDSDWKKYIQQILKGDEKCLVAGSYYFVGEVKSYLGSFTDID